ncbi:uncharacterized protein LOC125714437 isoform X2 [Brienomyrus brachyistius]|uniref:uncharacterized protein LOC125714437 isoform X2 n=1 Tax=Brienomyrus brachyistius TaxID=42636 RepID=UPI0020B2495D|nr:uncharacterized protein LOC125714437 isoform X2 [Brienomyrus brachyistius]
MALLFPHHTTERTEPSDRRLPGLTALWVHHTDGEDRGIGPKAAWTHCTLGSSHRRRGQSHRTEGCLDSLHSGFITPTERTEASDPKAAWTHCTLGSSHRRRGQSHRTEGCLDSLHSGFITPTERTEPSDRRLPGLTALWVHHTDGEDRAIGPKAAWTHCTLGSAHRRRGQRHRTEGCLDSLHSGFSTPTERTEASDRRLPGLTALWVHHTDGEDRGIGPKAAWTHCTLGSSHRRRGQRHRTEGCQDSLHSGFITPTERTEASDRRLPGLTALWVHHTDGEDRAIGPKAAWTHCTLGSAHRRRGQSHRTEGCLDSLHSGFITPTERTEASDRRLPGLTALWVQHTDGEDRGIGPKAAWTHCTLGSSHRRRGQRHRTEGCLDSLHSGFSTPTAH